MTWMNEYDIEEAADRFIAHPVLGPATRTLYELMRAVNSNSDGWPYWRAPANAAAKLMELIQGDRSWDARYGDRPDVTLEQLRKAYRPIKAFRTRHGLAFDLYETEADYPALVVSPAVLVAAALAELREALTGFHDAADGMSADAEHHWATALADASERLIGALGAA